MKNVFESEAKVKSLSHDFETYYLLENGDHKIIMNAAAQKHGTKAIQKIKTPIGNEKLTTWNFTVGNQEIKLVNSRANQEWTGLKIDLSAIYHRGIIKSAKLSLNREGEDAFELYEVNPEGNVIGKKIADGKDGVELVSLVLQNSGEPVYLATPVSNASDAIAMEVEYHPSDELLKGQQYLEVINDDFMSCKIDVLSGVPYPVLSVFHLGGNRFPLRLNLHYDYLNPENALKLDSGLGTGWYTNFHQICYSEELEHQAGETEKEISYIYIDSNRIKHIFRLAINSDSIWVDTQGTGLMLKKESNGIKIFDEMGSYRLFDQYGRLTEISLHQSDQDEFKNTVTYVDQGGRINTITDGMGRKVEFTYGSEVGVSLNGIKKLTISEMNGRTFRFLNVGNNNLEYYLRKEESSLFIKVPTRLVRLNTSSENDNGTETNNRVTSVRGTLNLYDFSYEYLLTTVAISNMSGIQTTRWAYLYDENCANINIYEIKQGNDYSSNYKNRGMYEFGFGLLSEKKLVEFSDLTLKDDDRGQSETIEDYGSLIDGEFYVFSAAFIVDGDNPTISSLPTIKLYSGDRELCSLSFQYQCKTIQVKTAVFRFQKDNTSNNENPNSITIRALKIIPCRFTNISITPIQGDLQMIATDKDMGNGSIQKGNDKEDKFYYVQKTVSFLAHHPNNTFDQLDIPLYASDYFANERNYYTREEDEPWNMWADNRRKMIVNVTDVTLIIGSIPNIEMSIMSMKYYLLSNQEHTMNSIRRSHDREDQEEFERNGRRFLSYMHETNVSYTKGLSNDRELVATSHYTEESFYDKFNRIIELRNPKKKDLFYYTTEGYLASTREQALSELTENIEQWWGYTNDYLTSQHSYYEKEEIISKMEYDDIGNLVKSINPQNLVTNYEYDEYGVDISKVSAIIESETWNDIQYKKGLVEVLANSSKTFYKFSYDEYNRVKSVQINNVEYANIDYQVNDQFNKNTVTYGNGQSVKRYTDPYGNLVRVEGTDGTEKTCTYYYGDQNDETGLPDMSKVNSSSKLKTISDHFVDATITFTYNDYGNVATIGDLENSSYFIQRFGYDDRQRLTSQIYHDEYGYPDIHVSYEYETGNNADQNIVKKTNITIYPNLNLTNPTPDINLSFEVLKDELNRVESEEIKTGAVGGMVKRYEYVVRNVEAGYGSGTTNFIERESFAYHDGTTQEIEYKYDLNGNITSIKRGNRTTKYIYDAASRLIEEENPYFGKKKEYKYDESGNIAEIMISNLFPMTAHSWDYYKYDEAFPDRLIKNISGTFEYDACGNPTVYKRNIMKWVRGRLLSRYYYGGTNGENVAYVYDGSGTLKTKNRYIGIKILWWRIGLMFGGTDSFSASGFKRSAPQTVNINTSIISTIRPDCSDSDGMGSPTTI